MAEERIRVLLVDDDEEDFILTADLLREAQGARFDLEWAEDFASGLEALKARRHDAFLVDYYLGPNGSGTARPRSC
jgi:two-component system, cell cycle sensor histidine kinase and response regulator CckA